LPSNKNLTCGLPTYSLNYSNNNDKLEKHAILNNSFNNCHYVTKNNGQLDNETVRFYIQGKNIWFLNNSIIFEIFDRDCNNNFDNNEKSLLIKLMFKDGNKIVPEGNLRMPHYSNYFYGNDPLNWVTFVPNYQEIFYNNLYDNIDLKFFITSKGLKYEFIIHPGGDPKNIKLKYEGIQYLSLNNNKDLVIKTPILDFIDSELLIYQNIDNEIQPINGKFKLINQFSYGFDIITKYDINRDLIIDPIIYSTYIGGINDDRGIDIQTDAEGNAYVIGNTKSSDFPISKNNSINSTYSGNQDIFILKLNPNGSSLNYSTYIGGNNDDYCYDIAIDSLGNSYLIGETRSTNFPTTTAALNTSFNGGLTDAFVIKLSHNGSNLNYSTYIGGSDSESARGIEIDLNNNSYVCGFTRSSDFPITINATDSTHNGTLDCFMFILNKNGSSLIYSTFYGGSSSEFCYDIKIDIDNIYMTGMTLSSDFPISSNAYDKNLGGIRDGFIIKLNFTSNNISYSTYFGGTSDDWGHSLIVDKNNSVLVCGNTKSNNFPITTSAFDNTLSGTEDGFILKLNSSGDSLIFSTYIGGSTIDSCYSMDIDSKNYIYVTGKTDSSNFPVTKYANDTSLNGKDDCFLLKINISGDKLLYSTYIGGTNNDVGVGLSLDLNLNVFITGYTDSTDFPITTKANDTVHNGNEDVFVLKMRVPGIYMKNLVPISQKYTNSNTNITINEKIIDLGMGINLSSIILRYRINSDTWTNISNWSINNNVFSVLLNVSKLKNNDIIKWYWLANDTFDNQYNDPIDAPYFYYQIIIDRIQPIIYNETPENNTWVSGLTKFSVELDDNISKINYSQIYYKWDDSNYGIGDGWSSVYNSSMDIVWDEINTTYVEKGVKNHTLYWYIEDLAGNNNTEGFNYKIDNIIPQTMINISNPKYRYNDIDNWNITNLTTFNFTIIEFGSGINFTKYRIDNDDWIEYNGPFNFSMLSEGMHKLFFFSSDKAGNVEFINSIIFFKDDSPPITFINIGDPKFRANDGDYWNVTSATTFNLTIIDTFSGIEKTYYKIDNSLLTLYNNDFNLSQVEDGFHLVYFYSMDNLGNIETTKYVKIFVDNTPPSSQITINGVKYGDNPVYVTSKTKFIIENNDDGVGVSYSWFKINDGNTQIYSNPITLSDGTNILEWGCVDYLGNSEESKNIEVYVDNTPPSTEININNPKFGDEPIYITTLTRFSITNNNDEGGVGLSKIQYKFSDSPEQEYKGSFTVPKGTTNISWRSVDLLGNNESIKIINIKIDEKAPNTIMNLNGPEYGSNPIIITSLTTIDLSANDLDSGVNNTYYKIDNDNNWIKYINPFNLIDEGKYNIRFYSIDHLGNIELKNNIEIIVDNTPPDPPIINKIKSLTNKSKININGISEPDCFIEIFINSNLIISDNTGETNDFSFEIDLYKGSNKITATATDVFNRTSSLSKPQIIYLDTINPKIDNINPESERREVSLSTNISITFSEKMNITITEKSFSISPSISGDFKWDNNVLTFTPNTNLTLSTMYLISISFFAKDLAGNTLNSDYYWNFTTFYDTDNDGYADFEDMFPENSTEWNDSDGDLFGDNCDKFPNDKNEWIDSDIDGIGNNADPDDDNDNISDENELLIGTNPLLKDTDGDNYNDGVDDFPLDETRWEIILEKNKENGDGFNWFIAIGIAIIIITILMIILFLKLRKKPNNKKITNEPEEHLENNE
jgi:hypothetical protein